MTLAGSDSPAKMILLLGTLLNIWRHIKNKEVRGVLLAQVQQMLNLTLATKHGYRFDEAKKLSLRK